MQAGAETTDPESRAPAAPTRLALARICCGLFGVQIVWGLQNVNTSRIFQSLGANLAELPILWIAAPITGLLVQPIVGHFSDHTWGRLGRRRPYLVGGAAVSAVALVLMPSVSTLWAASVMLWLLTASINVAMEPFRALIGDVVPERDRTRAFAMQVAFIGAGAVFASALPWIIAHWTGADARPGAVSQAVRLAFYVGAAGLLLTVAVTAWTTVEPPPDAFAASAGPDRRPDGADPSWRRLAVGGGAWILAGFALSLVTALGGYRRELYLIAAIAGLLGLGQIAGAWKSRRGAGLTGLLEIVRDVVDMPELMRRLAIVQFFTWFGLFALWIYAVPAIAAETGAGRDPASGAYNARADWVGVVFAFYNGVAVLGAFFVPRLAARIGRREAHACCLAIGAAGLAGFAFVTEAVWLLVPAVAVGCAWASIMSAPYAMVSSAVPATRMGSYMGIHNVFLVIPQLVGAALLGWIVDRLLFGQARLALLLAAAAFLVAAVAALTIPDHAGRRAS